MNDPTILCEGPFTPDAIDVQWNPAHIAFDSATQTLIDQLWDYHLAAAKSESRSLFNAPITRLIRAEKKNNRLLLTLGPTDYKTFLITTLRDRHRFPNLTAAQSAAALGNSALLTHSDQALLGIRSPRTAAYPNRAHLIGGVLDLLGTPELPSFSVHAILTHLQKEILEETTLTSADLEGHPVLLAIVRDEFLAQPELIWHWKSTLSISRIAEQLTKDEHSGACVIEKSQIPPETFDQMTPVARAAWNRWRKT
jgi:hypothetical protein